MQRAHIRGSTLLVLGRVLSVLLTTATHIVIVRALSKDEFGGFAYALALAGASQVLLSLGQAGCSAASWRSTRKSATTRAS
jgi:O-antigen/teichoic acid export membrane protein